MSVALFMTVFDYYPMVFGTILILHSSTTFKCY